MTDAEKDEAARRSGLYGTWVAATFAVPVSLAVVERSPLFIAIAIVLSVGKPGLRTGSCSGKCMRNPGRQASYPADW